MRNYDDIKAEIISEFEDEIPDIKSRNLKGVLPRVLTREECRKLIEYYSGIRIGELAGLKKADINFEEEILFIRSGKGDKDRYVCLDSSTLSELSGIAQKMPLTANIFPITDRQIRRIVEEAGEKTGISESFDALGRKFSAHSLRHAFATHCIENGMNIFTLKKLLGHEFLDTTEIYISTSMRFDKEEYLKSRAENT